MLGFSPILLSKTIIAAILCSKTASSTEKTKQSFIKCKDDMSFSNFSAGILRPPTFIRLSDRPFKNNFFPFKKPISDVLNHPSLNFVHFRELECKYPSARLFPF